MTTEKALERFRKQFPLTNVMVYDDYMVYSVPAGYVKSSIKDATNLIKQLKLPLEAVSNSNKSGVFMDTFLVKSK